MDSCSNLIEQFSPLDFILRKMTHWPSVNKSDSIDASKSAKVDLKKSIQLYSFDAIPEYLQSNPYIRRGYRYGLTAKGCLIRYLSTKIFPWQGTCMLFLI